MAGWPNCVEVVKEEALPGQVNCWSSMGGKKVEAV